LSHETWPETKYGHGANGPKGLPTRGWRGGRHSLSLLRGCIGYYHYNGAWRSYELRAGDELQVLEKIDGTVLVSGSMGPLYARQMYVKATNLGML
jgi:hypothetical protein